MNALRLAWRWFIYLYGFFIFGLMCLLALPFALPLALAPAPLRRSLQGLARQAAHCGFVFVRWHCHWTGFATLALSDRSEGRRGRLLVANHITMFDIVLIFSFFPRIQTLVNAKFYNNPLLWAIVRCCGYIVLNPGRSEEGAAVYRSIEDCLRSGATMILFPEGTRGQGSALGPLKRGIFRLAAELQIPFSPVFFVASQPFLTRQVFVPRERGRVRLEAFVLPALDSRDQDAKSLQDSFEAAYHEFFRTPSQQVGAAAKNRGP